jgi:KDO2-lipid IV(A) lauroyltransferase
MAKLRAKQIPGVLAHPIYHALRAGVCALGMGDLAGSLAVARRVGRAWGGSFLTRRRLQRAVEHLGVAFPEWSPQRRLEYALRSYEHLFMLALEVIYTPRLLSYEGWAGRVELHDLGPIVRRLLTEPVIFVGGHCGNWELSGYSLGILGFPMHALYRPLDLRPADEWVRQVRGRRGLVLVDKFGAARQLAQIMQAGAPLGFVADQNAGDRGEFVPYFGRLTSSYKAIALTALRHHATIAVGHALRLGGQEIRDDQGRPTGLFREPEGLRYRIEAVDVFGPEEYLSQPDPAFYIAARYRRAIERSVRAAPEQYLWMHRYWKSRPRWNRRGRTMPPAVLQKLRALPWMTDSELDRIIEWDRRDAAMFAQQTDRPDKPPHADQPPNDRDRDDDRDADGEGLI